MGPSTVKYRRGVCHVLQYADQKPYMLGGISACFRKLPHVMAGLNATLVIDFPCVQVILAFNKHGVVPNDNNVL